ncbi:S8 family peptidase [Chitinophaga nivalis]|uniref:S8 family peptidase n=1 Tax=Chitinophaga nivalis TaxID=2991709 RepID=A0ABT3IPY3_9BACT|nr:S8 family peptidase [Chitinophaga nivalis]MCW3464280.1 S8 family peptidase [Chitinophaga nivalis]MCW3486029.1 S8 family peptidase [Chitinophaga nivalis]
MKHITSKVFSLLLLLLICCNFVAAREKMTTDSILFRYAADTVGRLSNPAAFLVKFSEAPIEKILDKYGLIKALTRHHYILKRLPADSATLKKTVYSYIANNNWKATNTLLQTLENMAVTDSLTVQIGYQHAAILLEHARLQYDSKQYAIAILQVSKRDWPAFIAQPDVITADIIRRPVTEMIVNISNSIINRISIAQQQYPGIQGKSITVSVKEDLFDTTDIDLQGRYIASAKASNTLNSHATAMATLIAGAGSSGSKGLGVIPAASLLSSGYNIGLIPDDDRYFQQYRITVQNHSYGSTVENKYDGLSAAFDQLIVTTDTLVQVTSSGNVGTETSASGRYQGIPAVANLSSSFKQAKNLLIVGGTSSSFVVERLSSRGPTYDGRIKPDVTAYGEDGTSGASAMTSGVVGLLQDAWRQRFGNVPSSALIKAIIINSAWLPKGLLPAYTHGYGNLHALGAMQTIQENRYRQGTATPRQTSTFDINVPAGTQQVKVTLCWNDPAATKDAPKALINDLDMTITDAGGHTYLPWILSSYPSADSLKKTAWRGQDHVNNTEQISITQPPAGPLRISVKADALSSASQAFYLAYAFTPENTFQWQNPVAARVLPAGQLTQLQWETTFSGTGDLSYSLDSGATWITLAQQIPIQNGTWNWSAPDVLKKAFLKFSLPDTAFISPAFYISPTADIKVGFNCSDSVMLYWSPVPGAAAYQAYAMGATTLVPYKQTVDTFVFIAKQQTATPYFAVAPVAPAGWAGEKGYTINYTRQGVDCYVKSLLADKTTDNKVALSLSLGSTYMLKNVHWEKLSHGVWQPLGTEPVNQATTFNHLDGDLWEGIINYRVRLETVDGRNYYSDSVSIQILMESDIILFPNPASTHLYILDKEPHVRQVVITDMAGRTVLLRTITDMQSAIPLQQLANGLYYCTVYLDGKKILAKKFVKQQ